MKTLLVTLTIFLGTSCKGISFDPDAYVGDYENQSIVNENGKRVYCNTVEFNQFAAMHISKWQELREILLRARIPKEQKEIHGKKIDNIIGVLNE